jgi:hypothetical protein
VKPSLTVDERGFVVHFTNDAGEGVALPLTAEMVGGVVAGVQRCLTPEGKTRVLRGLGALVLELVTPQPEKKDDEKNV